MTRRVLTIVLLLLLAVGGFVSMRILEARSRKPDGDEAGVPTLEKEKSIIPADSVSSSKLSFRTQKLPFVYQRGESDKKLPLETTGGGVAILDYDRDGDIDLFFPQGGNPLVDTQESNTCDVLLRNDGKGVFVDVSKQAGLSPKGYGQGAAAADYDGDGDIDVYVTRYNGNTLWRNEGNGTFTDATEHAGVKGGLWSLGAAFFDFDNDGDLDLFVANYFDFDPAKAPYERDPKTGEARYGFPARFDGQPDQLFRNEGRGRFVDVSVYAKIAGKGRGMGVLASDLNDDGKIDIFVANDAQANGVWRNKGDGTFEETSFAWGLAVNGEGMAEANMGIAHGDTDGDQLLDILVTHFYDEHATLWRKLETGPGGQAYYQDQTSEAALAVATRPLTGWGTAFADFDQDGALDLIIANGHIRPEPHQRFRFHCPPLVMRNLGSGRFVDASDSAGPYFKTLQLGRGLAVGDLDDDGDLDAVVVHFDTPSVVLWNDAQAKAII